MSRGVTRRNLLKGGVLLPAAAARAGAASSASPARACILINCVGGMSQLDTWDPKPDAPSEVRGPFRAIDTTAHGVRISEILPELARKAHRFTLVRSVTADYPPIHEAGLQAIATGQYRPAGAGRRLSERVQGLTGNRATSLLPGPLGFLGVPIPTGQDAPQTATGADSGIAGVFLAAERKLPGCQALGSCGEPSDAADTELESRAERELARETARTRDRFGRHPFGEACLRAVRQVEAGAAFVTVNQFQHLFGEATWDCHASTELPTTVEGLRMDVARPFDQGLAALIAELGERGLLDSTLVCAFTEFGRSPILNSAGGRDHHTGCWSVLLAGGGLPGGRVIGASDAHGAEPLETPVSPKDLAATVLHAFGGPAGVIAGGARALQTL